MSEGQRMAEQDRRDNADIDVAASRARFARKTPARIVPADEAPVIVTPVTSTTAESLALLAAIDMEATRKETAVGDRFLNQDGEDLETVEVDDRFLYVRDDLGFVTVLSFKALTRLLAEGIWTRWTDPQTAALGNVLI
jgi:hypothetical protein